MGQENTSSELLKKEFDVNTDIAILPQEIQRTQELNEAEKRSLAGMLSVTREAINDLDEGRSYEDLSPFAVTLRLREDKKLVPSGVLNVQRAITEFGEKFGKHIIRTMLKQSDIENYCFTQPLMVIDDDQFDLIGKENISEKILEQISTPFLCIGYGSLTRYCILLYPVEEDKTVRFDKCAKVFLAADGKCVYHLSFDEKGRTTSHTDVGEPVNVSRFPLCDLLTTDDSSEWEDGGVSVEIMSTEELQEKLKRRGEGKSGEDDTIPDPDNKTIH